MTSKTSTSGSASAPAAPDHRKNLMDKLDAYDLGTRILKAFKGGAGDKANVELGKYVEKFVFDREATSRGISADEYKAIYGTYTDEEKNSILMAALPVRQNMSRDEALKTLEGKGNLEAILDGDKDNFAKLLERDSTLSYLEAIAGFKEDKAALNDINDCKQFVQLGKYLEQLKQYESNLGDPAKAPEYKKKKGRDILVEVPATHREAIGKAAIRIAVDEARKGLAKGEYSEATANALSELNQLIASIDPSYALIRKAVEKVKKDVEAEHNSVKGNTNLKERMYEHMKSNMRYAVESQDEKLQSYALNLAYAGLNKEKRFIGEGTL
jgi:hypothetical protein